MVLDAGQFSIDDFAERIVGLSFRFLARKAKISFVRVNVSLTLFSHLLVTQTYH